MRSGKSHISELVRKYQSLRELREAAHPSPPPQLKELAGEFPGALRELDILPKAVLDERLAQCERALVNGASEPWMAWIYTYHATMRAALKLKTQLAGHRDPNAKEVHELVVWLNAATGSFWDGDFVRNVAAPPQGRLNRVVLEHVAKVFDLSPETLISTLFPSRPRCTF